MIPSHYPDHGKCSLCLNEAPFEVFEYPPAELVSNNKAKKIKKAIHDIECEVAVEPMMSNMVDREFSDPLSDDATDEALNNNPADATFGSECVMSSEEVIVEFAEQGGEESTECKKDESPVEQAAENCKSECAVTAEVVIVEFAEQGEEESTKCKKDESPVEQAAENCKSECAVNAEVVTVEFAKRGEEESTELAYGGALKLEEGVVEIDFLPNIIETWVEKSAISLENLMNKCSNTYGLYVQNDEYIGKFED